MRPVDRDAFLRPAIGTAPPPVPPWPDTTGGLDTEPAQRHDAGQRSSTLRPGWYAYRVTGTAELPSWAVEIALSIERPVASTVEAPDGGPTGGGPTGGGLWVGESLDPFAPEPAPPPMGGPAQAMVLLRAPGRLRWLDGIAEAITEVETIAGIRALDPVDDPVPGIGGAAGIGGASGASGMGGAWGMGGPCDLRHRTGPVLPGLAPVTAAVARAHLRTVGSRGLPAPLRRRRPATAGIEFAWRAGAGCVLTCDGPDGRSAQAVVRLRGMGNPAAIAPPPGGALVLRAWRARGGYGLACGLVLGASATLGLGREARRVAAVARSEGWDASVLTGSAAVHLAQAGSPRRPAPRDVAQAATGTQVAAMLEACLIATDTAGDSNANRPARPGTWR